MKNTILVITPGQTCLSKCEFCVSTRGDISDILNITPEYINRIVDVFNKLNIAISQFRIAGQCEDFFAIRNLNRIEILSVMVDSLQNDHKVTKSGFEIGGITIISNGLSITPQNIAEIKSSGIAQFLNLTLSIDLGHHNGSGLCNRRCSSFIEFIEKKHIKNCKYFAKMSKSIKLVRSVIPEKKIVINYCLDDLSKNIEMQKRMIKKAYASYFKILSNQIYFINKYYATKKPKKVNFKIEDICPIFVDVRGRNINLYANYSDMLANMPFKNISLR